MVPFRPFHQPLVDHLSEHLARNTEKCDSPVVASISLITVFEDRANNSSGPVGRQLLFSPHLTTKNPLPGLHCPLLSSEPLRLSHLGLTSLVSGAQLLQ